MARPHVSIVSAGHDVADARLHRHVAALDARGLTVEVIGLGDPAAAPPAASRVVTVVRPGLAGRFLRARKVTRIAEGSLVVTLDPDVLALASPRALGKHGQRLIADVHEDYAALLRDRAWARTPAGLVGHWIARRAVRRASACALVSVADDHLLPGVEPRLVVRNVPSLPAAVPLDERPRAVYVGDIRASRGAFAMLDAIAGVDQWSLDLVGPIAADDREAVLSRIAELKGRVRWHDRQPPERAWAIAAGAWVGFALLDDTPAFRDATPSKLYEYAAHGMLMVATDLPGHRRLREEIGVGELVDDTAAAQRVLNALAADPDAARQASAAVAARARELPVFTEGSERLATALAAMIVKDEQR